VISVNYEPAYVQAALAAASFRSQICAIHFHLSQADRDDLYQTILLDALERSCRFDPAKGTLAGEVQGPVYLGALPTEPQAVWTGHLFDFCVTKGVARQITSYTPWKLKSLGPQIAKSGATEPDWPDSQNATVTDGAYTWTAKHRVVQPLIEGPIWPVEANA
jgi:hypothetical protein